MTSAATGLRAAGPKPEQALRGGSQPGVQFLYRVDLQPRAMPEVLHAFYRSTRPCNSGEVGNPRCEGRGTDRSRIIDGIASLVHRIDHQADFAVFKHIDNMRAAFGDLVYGLDGNAGIRNGSRRTACTHQLEAEFVQATSHFNGAWLVAVFYANEHHTRFGQTHACGQL